MGVEPTGASNIVSGISIQRFADGKIVEGWMNFDSLGMIQAIGAVPSRA